MDIIRKARSTKTTVYLEDNGKDYPDGRWMTACLDHGGCVCHETRALALQWLSHPEDWCPTCQETNRERIRP